MPGNNQMVIDFLGDGRITLPKVEKLMQVIKTQSGSEEFELSAGQLIITGLKKA